MLLYQGFKKTSQFPVICLIFTLWSYTVFALINLTAQTRQQILPILFPTEQ